MTVNETIQPDLPENQPAPGDQLLLRINHEIRIAVNATLGMTELLLESQLTREQDYRVNVIRMSIDHLLTESCRILDLVRAESGFLQLDVCRFDLRETLRQAVELLSFLAGHSEITLKTSISDNLPTALMGDPMRISEILFAVVRATMKRIETGEISIAVEGRPCGAQAATISFSVAHPGPCMNSSITLEGSDGFEDGIALALARRLTRMMDGDLTIEPGHEEGIEFRFAVTLPIANPMDSNAGPAPVRQAQNGDSRPLRILMAEDALNNQLLVQAFLRDEPWAIDTAVNGRIAVEKAAAKSYNLILMDLDMPEMDGYAATRQIRIDECLSQVSAVPIVALTAHNETQAVVKCFEAGCIAHVTKPFTKANLIETIQHYAV